MPPLQQDKNQGRKIASHVIVRNNARELTDKMLANVHMIMPPLDATSNGDNEPSKNRVPNADGFVTLGI
jgi:hypothetical protein